MIKKDKIRFRNLTIDGAFALTLESNVDIRGVLIRVWEENYMLADFTIKEVSVVSNPNSHTLRGLHYQRQPFTESKIIQCISGKIFDVIVDLRESAVTYLKTEVIEIGPLCDFQGVLIPPGCAHGYMTMTENTIIIYFMDNNYSLAHSHGIRWNDPKLGIQWPSEPKIISIRDSNWPLI